MQNSNKITFLRSRNFIKSFITSLPFNQLNQGLFYVKFMLIIYRNLCANRIEPDLWKRLSIKNAFYSSQKKKHRVKASGKQRHQTITSIISIRKGSDNWLLLGRHGKLYTSRKLYNALTFFRDSPFSTKRLPFLFLLRSSSFVLDLFLWHASFSIPSEFPSLSSPE